MASGLLRRAQRTFKDAETTIRSAATRAKGHFRDMKYNVNNAVVRMQSRFSAETLETDTDDEDMTADDDKVKEKRQPRHHVKVTFKSTLTERARAAFLRWHTGVDRDPEYTFVVPREQFPIDNCYRYSHNVDSVQETMLIFDAIADLMEDGDKKIPNAIQDVLGDDLVSDVALELDFKTYTWTARFDTALPMAEIDRLFAEHLREHMILAGDEAGRAYTHFLDAVGLRYKVSTWSAKRQRKATSEDYYMLQKEYYAFVKRMKSFE